MGGLRVAITLEQCWHEVPGGTARSVIDMVAALAAHEPAVDPIGVVARHDEPPPPPWQPPIEVRQLRLPRRLLYQTWGHFGWPDVEAATGPVDVTHATTFAIPGTTAPLVVTVHDLAFLHEPDHFTRRGVAFFDRGVKRTMRHAAAVVCPSEASAEDCRRIGFRDDRLRVVPFGADPVEVTDEDRRRVRESYGLDRRFVFFAGTVEPRKNLGGLLVAFERLGRDDLSLVIAGPAGWKEDLDALVAGSTRDVRRIGFVPDDDLSALYAEASVFCAPSLREGFGLPVLEAMHQGTPVVTSAGTSTAEIVGDAGVLVEPTDPDDIARGIEEALDDARFGPAGRERATRFTTQASAAGYARVYREVAR